MYRNILVATDGSELAERAVAQGLELARALRAKVTAVTVTDYLPVGSANLMPQPSDAARYESAAARTARGLLDQVRAKAEALGVACDTVHVADELPAEGIVKACNGNGCDLIIMATHGRRGLDRLLIGSQTNKVLAASSVPVLVCR